MPTTAPNNLWRSTISTGTPNHLITETSAYLLQHAYNPVQWYPWGDEAFALAREQDKPVFVSIGYSTCHWCHVMAHESFENTEIADYLNEHFVSVKVDREERPDVDAFCMEVCQATTGHGGWPLTVVMDAERRPFFTGTYFPPRTTPRRLGLLDILRRIRDVWVSNRDAISTSAATIVEAVQKGAEADVSSAVPANVMLRVADHLRGSYDEEFAGFGSAPKFPSPHRLLLLFLVAARTRDAELIVLVANTLRAMRAGGIYDQVGYGFHRYSTDRQWHVPHFEKMLYDQAMLMMAYTEAWKATKDEVMRRTVLELAEYIATEMTAADGSFYSAQDADSEGEEGKFYVYTAAELESVSAELSPRHRLGLLLGVRADGNFSHEATGDATGTNILHVHPDALERLLADPLWEDIRERLVHLRKRRIPPRTDTKILPDWNGLMIAALARAARTFHQAHLGLMAERAYRNIAPRAPFLDDHAMLGLAALELYETTGTGAYLAHAVRMAKHIRTTFADERGVLRMVSGAVQDVPVHPRLGYDGAYPSGNSIAALLMIRLGAMLHDKELTSTGQSYVEHYGQYLENHGSNYCMLLYAWDLAEQGMVHVVIGGPSASTLAIEAMAEIGEHHLPWWAVVHQPRDEETHALFRDAAYPFHTMKESAIHICTAEACELPIVSMSDLLRRLERESTP